jgi:hypothetical protein
MVLFRSPVIKIVCGPSRNFHQSNEDIESIPDFFHIVKLKLEGIERLLHVKHHPTALCEGLMLSGHYSEEYMDYKTDYKADSVSVELPSNLPNIRKLLKIILRKKEDIPWTTKELDAKIKEYGGQKLVWQTMHVRRYEPFLMYQSTLVEAARIRIKHHDIIRFLEELSCPMDDSAVERISTYVIPEDSISMYETLTTNPMILFNVNILELKKYTTALKYSSLIGQDDHIQLDLLLELYNFEKSGSTCMPFDRILPAKSEQVIHSHGHLFRRQSFAIEEKIATELRHRMKVDKFSVPTHLQTTGLTVEQAAAVRQCLYEPVSCITGGPGTGKSFLLQIVQDSMRGNDCCMLLAPTGVVVCRLIDNKRANTRCRTIHSFNFEYEKIIHKNHDIYTYTVQEDEFAAKKIECRIAIVVVDEATMMDNILAAELLARLPYTVRLVFMGDCNQLNSVGPGAVLRECLTVLPTVRLHQVFRQGDGSGVLGALTHVLNDRCHPPSTGTFVSMPIYRTGLEHVTLALVVQQPTTVVVVHTNSVREQLNRLLQGYHNPPTDEKHELQWYNKTARQSFLMRVGDRVVCLKNKDRLIFGIANGSVGTLCAIRIHRENDKIRILEVTFDNGHVQHFEVDGCKKDTKTGMTISTNRPPELDLAYTITVHKSQGSEYDHVLFVDVIETMRQRKSTYTALSRAKLSCHHIYTPGSFTVSMERHSCISMMLSNKRGRSNFI